METIIRPGDSIVHPNYGEGKVLNITDRFFEVQFTCGVKNISAAWAVENCTILRPDRPKSVAPLTREQLELQKTVQRILTTFGSFFLTDGALQELERFFTFKANYAKGHKSEVRYNLLIQCENLAESVRFIQLIEQGLRKLNALDKGLIRVSEADYDAKTPAKFPLDCSAIAIYNCASAEKDSVAIVSSGIRSSIQRQRREKDQLWESIVKRSAASPGCTVIACGPKGFVDYIRQSDDLYYRFFAHRIFLRPMTIDEVTELLFQEILNQNLRVSPEFRTGITNYIQVVYPKADLKDTAFVQDLLNRILVNYYLSAIDGVVGEECIPFYRKPRTFDEISVQLDSLVGLKKVKQEFRNLYKLSQDPRSVNKQRLHFAFVGNPGTGKTTVANLTAELLFSMGLIRRNKLVVVTPTDVISIYKGESAQLMMEKIQEAQGGVLFVDEAYFLTSKTSETNSPQKQVLETLLQEMERNSDNLSVIFAGYEEEIDELLGSNPGLKSRVPYRFQFEDYSTEELLRIFQGLAAKEGMSLAKDALGVMEDRIALARADENFGNARTMANIYQQLKVVWLEQDRQDRIFTKEDVQATMPVALHTNLDNMIGLTSVKQELKAFESRIKYIKFLKDKDVSIPTPNMHMMFTGNPGTGKTTVAKMIADCLYQIGVLKTNKLVVAERKDLVDSFVGGTATKTSELIRKAMNGVLFIDEAYALYRPDDAKDFGTEAIATLITAMESHKDKLVVIFAGYQDEMALFQQANPGISSRIGFTFHFPDYTPEELTQMFGSKMTKNGFVVEPAAAAKVLKIMEYFTAMKNFGNGRFVDRIMDLAISNRSFRPYVRRYNDISEADIPDVQDLARLSAQGHTLNTGEGQSQAMRRRISIHESGHAVVSRILLPQHPVKSLSINADAASGGRLVVDSGRDSLTESEMRANLAVRFGGRNAERLVLGSHSTGCYSDMSTAKKIAEDMITDLAMGELGVTTPMDLLQEADHRATEVLTTHQAALERIAEHLLQHGSISGSKLDAYLFDQP